jgi:hypothetical protein
MSAKRIGTRPGLLAAAWMVASGLNAAEFRGTIKCDSLPVPGVTVSATQTPGFRRTDLSQSTDAKALDAEGAIKSAEIADLTQTAANSFYFASGMTLTGIDNQAQLRATVNAAIRSNVAFYPVDSRGLVATAPLGDATQASQGGQGMYSGSSQRSAQSSFQGQQESLYTLASDTGGKALLDQNDLSLGIVQAQKGIDSYYVVGYYSTNTALDGRFRRIKVQVNRNTTAKLDYRSGYFASKEFRQFNSSERERQLQEALMLGDPVTDLTIALEINYFREARDRYFVPVSVKIPGSDIELARKSGAESSRLDFIGEVKDSKGALAATVRDHRKNGDVRNYVHDSRSFVRERLSSDQLRGTKLPAGEPGCDDCQCRKGQEADRGQSSGSGQTETGPQRDPRFPAGRGSLCLPRSLSARSGESADALGDRGVLPRQCESIRKRAAGSCRRVKREIESRADAIQPAAG